MKRLLILLLVIIFSGCTIIGDNISDNTEKILYENTVDNSSVHAVNIDDDVLSKISLSESQTIKLCDYRDNKILLLVYDPSRTVDNPASDQFTPKYYEKFVLIDRNTLNVIQQYPIKDFGYCSSAVYAFDGIVYSFFSLDSEQELNAAVIFSDGLNSATIHTGVYTPLGTGPILRYWQDSVLFSYYDYQKNCFGLNTINNKFEISPALEFNPSNTDYISDDFSTSPEHYVYAVGQNSAIVFYIVSYDNPANPMKIKLPVGEKIHGFCLSDKHLYVSIATSENPESNRTPCVEVFELADGQSENQYPLGPPLYSISTNNNDLLCGFTFSSFGLYNTDSGLSKIDLKDATIRGDFHEIFSCNGSFVVAVYNFDGHPSLWIIF